MENNESNLKPQPMGNLKIMTVFVAVLALHVVVLGGFAIYSFVKTSNGDTDLAADKTHKTSKTGSDTVLPGDVSAPDTASADKSGNTTTGTDSSASDVSTPVTTEVAGPPAAAPASAPSTASAMAAASPNANAPLAPTPAPVPMMVTPPPAADSDASFATANGPALTPASGPERHGPVINPPENLAPPVDATASGTTPNAAEASAPVADGTPYTVKKGDSLARIARHHHVALAQLKIANSLNSDRLHIGQKLVIPNKAEKVIAADGGATPSGPVTAATETADTSATNVPAPADPSAASDATTSPAVTASTVKTKHHKLLASATTGAAPHSAGSHHLYTVVKGDTLTKIARKFHTTSGALMAANNIVNARSLGIGKKLHIPSAGESRNAAASARGSEPTESRPKTAAHGQLANYVP